MGGGETWLRCLRRISTRSDWKRILSLRKWFLVPCQNKAHAGPQREASSSSLWLLLNFLTRCAFAEMTKRPCHRTIDIIDCQIAFSVRNCMSTEIMNLSDHPLFHRSPFYISLNETAGNCATEWCHHALGPTNWNLQSLSLPLGLRNLGPCQAVKNLHHAMDFLWLCIMLSLLCTCRIL